MANVIVSAPKRLLALACLALLLLAAIHYRQQQSNCTLKLSQTGCVGLETAITRQQQARGLGGRNDMSTDKGMLFIYKEPQRTCFWMKDTKFNLDIIWLNNKKEITKIMPNLSPDTYPQSYCSDDTTQYVIELKAGLSAGNGLEVGQKLNF